MRILFSVLLPILLLSLMQPSPVLAEAAPPLPAGALDRSEVIALFHNKTVESVTLSKYRNSVSYYSPTGEIRQLRDGKKRLGQWRVNKQGRICLQMEDDQEKCRIIVREGDGGYRKYIVRNSGPHKPVVGYRKFVEGNPGNL